MQVETLNDHFELVQDLKDIYQKSYVEYLTELQGWESNSQEVGGCRCRQSSTVLFRFTT